MTISLVMIVKDEAPQLRRNLPLLAPAVDEWVIVDTGSTDDTRDVIQEYCGVVRELPFEDFVTTKNKALTMATGDWILFCDADEVLETDPLRIRQWAEHNEADAYSCLIVERDPQTSAPVMSYHRLRLWRNDGGWQFVGPGVHEVCVGTGEIAYDNQTVFFHDRRHRSQESFEKRVNLYIEMLTKHLVEHPGEPRALFYMGRTLNDAGRYMEAVSWYLEYLQSHSDFRDERWQACYDIANCYLNTGDYAQALAILNQARSIDPRRAEADTLTGLIYYSLQMWHEAIEYFEKAIRAPLPEDVILFLNPTAYGPIPLDHLVVCYNKVGRHDDAVEAAEAYVSLTSERSPRTLGNIFFSRRAARPKIVFALGPTPEPVWGDMIAHVGVGGVETTYIELPKSLAAMGCEVFVFCRIPGNDHVSNGVRFVDYRKINDFSWIEPDAVIASRWFEAFDTWPEAKKIVWLQDAHFSDNGRQENVTGADAVVVSSRWHMSYTMSRYQQALDARKLRVIPLGIDKAMFPQGHVLKDRTQVIYSSNPDRGLFYLLDMWPKIMERVPGIHLVITYGWQGLKTWNGDQQWQSQVSESEAKVRAAGDFYGNIRVTGRLKKADLYAEMERASLCLYPNNFWETYCTHPNNEVFTDSGYHKITDVKIGDMVLTHAGRFRAVEKTMSRAFDGNLISLSLQNSKSDNGMFTPEHPVLVIPKNKARAIRMTQLGFGYSQRNLDYVPEWINIGNVKVGDFICTPGVAKSEDILVYDTLPDFNGIFDGFRVSDDGRVRWRERGYGAPRFLDMSTDFAKFLGLYMAEGCFSRNVIMFCFHEDETDLIDFVSNYAEKIGLGVRPLHRPENDKGVTVKINGKVFGQWLEHHFGCGARNKSVPGFVYHQSKEFILAFIEGVILGDGHKGKRATSIELVTRQGIRGIRMLLESVGISSSLHHSPRFDTYQLSISNGQIEKLRGESCVSNGASLMHNGQLYYKVKDIAQVPYYGPVYNLEVNGDNSYVSDFIAVHNCLTAAECQMAGTPLITSDIGGLHDIVGPGSVKIPGFPSTSQYQAQFIEAAADALVGGKIIGMEQEAREFARKHVLDWDEIAEAWRGFLWELLR